jgi:hypothetical protein
VDDKHASGEGRREEIGQRLAAIRTRMDELKAVRQDDASAAAVRKRISSAQRQAAASQAAAEHAIAASIRAFRRSAHAHEHAALQHDRAAAAGFGDKDQHKQQAARHRVAAVVDIQQAEYAQSLLGDQEAKNARRSAVDQTLDRLSTLLLDAVPTYCLRSGAIERTRFTGLCWPLLAAQGRPTLPSTAQQ